MKYCSQCGQSVTVKIPEGDNRQRHVCDHCELIHYQNPRIIAGCVPYVEERVLLCKRSIEPRYGLWTLPAGFLENGETVIAGAQRECYEEALAAIEDPKLCGIYDIPEINQVYIFYSGQLLDNRYGAGEESLDAGLFREDEIPWDEIAFPVVELMLHHYFEGLKNGFEGVRTGAIKRPWKWIRRQ